MFARIAQCEYQNKLKIKSYLTAQSGNELLLSNQYPTHDSNDAGNRQVNSSLSQKWLNHYWKLARLSYRYVTMYPRNKNAAVWDIVSFDAKLAPSYSRFAAVVRAVTVCARIVHDWQWPATGAAVASSAALAGWWLPLTNGWMTGPTILWVELLTASGAFEFRGYQHWSKILSIVSVDLWRIYIDLMKVNCLDRTGLEQQFLIAQCGLQRVNVMNLPFWLMWKWKRTFTFLISVNSYRGLTFGQNTHISSPSILPVHSDLANLSITKFKCKGWKKENWCQNIGKL